MYCNMRRAISVYSWVHNGDSLVVCSDGDLGFQFKHIVFHFINGDSSKSDPQFITIYKFKGVSEAQRYIM
jgi:hypothetical protein